MEKKLKTKVKPKVVLKAKPKVKPREVKPKVDKVYKTFMFPDHDGLIKARGVKEATQIHKNLRRK